VSPPGGRPAPSPCSFGPCPSPDRPGSRRRCRGALPRGCHNGHGRDAGDGAEGLLAQERYEGLRLPGGERSARPGQDLRVLGDAMQAVHAAQVYLQFEKVVFGPHPAPAELVDDVAEEPFGNGGPASPSAPRTIVPGDGAVRPPQVIPPGPVRPSPGRRRPRWDRGRPCRGRRRSRWVRGHPPRPRRGRPRTLPLHRWRGSPGP